MYAAPRRPRAGRLQQLGVRAAGLRVDALGIVKQDATQLAVRAVTRAAVSPAVLTAKPTVLAGVAIGVALTLDDDADACARAVLPSRARDLRAILPGLARDAVAAPFADDVVRERLRHRRRLRGCTGGEKKKGGKDRGFFHGSIVGTTSRPVMCSRHTWRANQVRTHPKRLTGHAMCAMFVVRTVAHLGENNDRHFLWMALSCR